MNPADFQRSHWGGTDPRNKDDTGPMREGGGAWAMTPHRAGAGRTSVEMRARGSVGQRRQTGHKFTALCPRQLSFLAGSGC